jgi:hypothetical protein
MKDAQNVTPLKRALFSPGEITISPEAFQSIRDAGLTPADLVRRHTQGDWDEGPGKWIARNHEIVSGREDGPVMSIYRLYPGETRICVGTTTDRSGTELTVWPKPDGHRAPVPVETAERISNESSHLAYPATGRSVKEIFDAWRKDKTIPRAAFSKKGPTRYGPDR